MIDKQNRFIFKKGLPGLPDELKEFNLIPLQKDSPFYLLQSLKDDNICFILINPFPIYPDYEFDLPKEEKTKLKIQSDKDVAVFCIVNASEGIKNAVVNQLAPIIVNTKTKTARQVVLNDKRYSIRQPLPRTSGEGQNVSTK